jgi:hypothetical protein
MNQHRQISSEQTELKNSTNLNLASNLDLNALREASLRAIEAMNPPMPGPCTWLRNGNVDPPKEVKEEPAARIQLESAQKIPLQMQESAEPITDSNGNGKQPRKLGFPPLADSLVDALGDATLALLPAMQERLLNEGVISEPIVTFPEEALPADFIPCKVGLPAALSAEPKAPPCSCHFDRDPTGRFDRLLRIWLNLCNPAMGTCLKKRNVCGVKFFVAAALLKCVSRDRSPLAQAILAILKMRVGLAPNQQITATAFAKRLAADALLQLIEELPIYGEASQDAFGRTFAVTEIDLRIPVAELGPPWNKPRKR